MHVKRIIKKTVKWSLIGVSALMLFVVLLFGLAQTGAGKECIRAIAVRSLSQDREQHIDIGRIDGLFPFDIQVDHLTFWDAGSQWLRLEDVSLRWSPLTLIHRNFVVDNLHIVSAQVNRPPVDRREKTVRKKAIPPWLGILHRLQIRNFSVEGMVLDASVLGEQAVFKIEAGVGISFPEGAWETRINIERLDQNGAPTTLRALFEGKGTDLTADALMEESAGGLVAKSLGIEGPILFSLKGKGPTDAWNGTVIAEGGTLGELRAELGLSMTEKNLRVTAEGRVHIDPVIVPDPLNHWVDQDTPFQLHLNMDKQNRLTIDDLKLKSERASLQINASVDLETEAMDGRFKFRSDDLSPLEKLASIKGTGGIVDGHFSGSLLKPEASLDFSTARLQAGVVQGKDAEGNVKVIFMKPINVAPIQIRVQGIGKFGELAIKTGNQLISEKDVVWKLVAEGPSKERLSIQQLELTGDPASILLAGWIDTSRHTGNVDANIDISDLSAFSRFVNSPLAGRTRLEAGRTRLEAGRTRLEAKITGDAGNRSLSARITGEYQPPEASNASLVSLVDGKVGYSGLVLYDGQKEIKGTGLLLDTTSGTLKGDIDYDLEDRGLNGVFQMEMPNLDRFSSILGKDLKGSMSVKGSLKGPVQKLSVDARLVSPAIQFEKWRLEQLSAGFGIEGFPPGNKGRLDFNLFVENERVHGGTHFTLTHQLLSFTDLSLNGAGVNITGALSLDLEQRLIEGTLQGATDDLVPLSPLLKQEVKGAAKIHLEASGTNSGQRFVFKIDSNDLSIRDLFAGNVKLQGEIEKAFKAPEGFATVSLREGKHKGSSVTSLGMNVRGTPRQFHFEGNVAGMYREDFDLETSGRVSLSPKGYEILLNRFQGRYGELPVNLVQPAVVSKRTEGLDVEPIMLQIGSGRLEGSGKIATDVSIAVQFMELSLSALPMNITSDLVGTANGQIQIRGSSRNPEVMGRLGVTGLGMHLPQTETLPPGTLEVKTDIRAGKLHADMTLQGVTATPIKVRFEAPVALSIAPFSISLPEKQPISGQIVGEVDLGLIEEIYALHDQVIAGRLLLNLTLAGHFGDLKVQGGGRIEDGHYENVRSGTILKGIEALFEAQDHRIVIQSVQASDGESGTIKAQGWVDIDPAAGFPFSIDLVLDEAKSWRHDDVMITLRGPLKLSGSLKGLLLEGRIQIARAEIQIPDRLPPDIVQLEVVEIHHHSPASTVNKEQSPTSESTQMQDFRLDVSIWSSGHVFVEGRGLSSEWEVNLQVSGTAAAPVITGQFSVIRGHVNFLGKRFNLTRGMIFFSGATPPSPQIDVLGESRANDMTAQIELSGPLNHPTVKLSSDPELPQDEVLSRLLFGRSLTSITPYQAFQLASAANTLAGGGGFDLLGQTRKILGIDQLEIKNLEGDKGETAISAGKYLSEHVYMEVEKGLGPKGGKGSVVWEMTPNITVETEIGENAEIGGGVNWKWDY